MVLGAFFIFGKTNYQDVEHLNYSKTFD